MIHEPQRGTTERNTKVSPQRINKSDSANKGLLESPPREQPSDILLKNSPSKQKYIPSRYGVNEAMQSNNTLSKNTLLNDLQHQMEMVDDAMSKMTPEKINNRLKEMKSYHPPSRSLKVVSEFKSKPIKKAENDLLMFKEIFVAPKEKVLHELRDKEKNFNDLVHNSSTKQYDKIVGVQKDESKNIFSTDSKLKREKVHFSTPKLPSNELATNTLSNRDIGLAGTVGLSKDKANMANVYKSHDKLQIPPLNEDDLNGPEHDINKGLSNERVFFEQQIQVQAPDTPNYATASPLTPGILVFLC